MMDRTLTRRNFALAAGAATLVGTGTLLGLSGCSSTGGQEASSASSANSGSASSASSSSAASSASSAAAGTRVSTADDDQIGLLNTYDYVPRDVSDADLASHPVHADLSTVPDDYLEQIPRAGRLERFTYSAHDVNGDPFDTEAMVYVPYGYDGSGRQAYDILYLQHGAFGTDSEWLGNSDVDGPTPAKYLLDNLMANGDIRPTLVVCPYISMERDKPGYNSFQSFQPQLACDLMPAVESAYRTFAPSVDADGFRTSRERRYFGGFSMGAYATWYVMQNYVDRFKYFVPMCGAMSYNAGPELSAQQGDQLSDALVKTGFAQTDYYAFAADGTDDLTYEDTCDMVEELQERPDAFTFSDTDFSAGNLMYYVAEGYYHNYESAYEYLYNALRMLLAPQ